jgi:hypothetical protein
MGPGGPLGSVIVSPWSPNQGRIETFGGVNSFPRTPSAEHRARGFAKTLSTSRKGRYDDVIDKHNRDEYCGNCGSRLGCGKCLFVRHLQGRRFPLVAQPGAD